MRLNKNPQLKYRYACFACTTPYQLMGAISIVQGTGIEADLYLIGSFSGYEEVARRLDNYKLFKNIILVQGRRARVESNIKILWRFLNRSREVKAFLAPNLVYEYFYSSSQAPIKLLLLYELRKRNPDLKYMIYEDGIGTYSKYAPSLNISKRNHLFEILAHSKIFIPERTSIMVHYPELLWLPDALKDIRQECMPSYNLDSSNIELLQDVFGMIGKDSITEKVILFDTARGVYRKDSTDIDLLDKCFKVVIDLFPHQDVVLKAHPKSNDISFFDVNVYHNSGIPMEVLYSNMHDLNNCILVGNHTTALYTPKMMFNKEPFVISLHKIAWKAKPQVSFIFDRLKSLYIHKERLYAPDTIEDLRAYLIKVKSLF